MSKIEEFKGFVKEHPKLLKYVKNGESSWQKFYEIYDLYGEEESAWKDYLGVATVATTAAAATSFADIINWVKTINLDSVQQGVNNLQRVLGVVQDLAVKDDKKTNTNEYKPRPMYKHFED